MCAGVCVALFCVGGRARGENSTQQQFEVHIFGRVAGSPSPPSPGELAEGLAGPSAAKQEVGSGRQAGGLGGSPQYSSYLFVHPVDAFCAPPLPSIGICGHLCPPAPQGCVPPSAPQPPHPARGALGSEKTPVLSFFQVVSPCINVGFFLVIFHYCLSPPIFFLPLPSRMSFPGGNRPQISQNTGGKTNQWAISCQTRFISFSCHRKALPYLRRSHGSSTGVGPPHPPRIFNYGTSLHHFYAAVIP